MTVDGAGFDRGVTSAWPLRHQTAEIFAAAVDPTRYADPDAAPDTPVPDVPLYPPARYFEPPDDVADPKLTVLTAGPDVGRVYGYVAAWGTCLLNGEPGCTTPPTSPSQYAAALQGATLLDDGTIIATANIGGGCNHARPGLPASMAADHYASTASQMMRVRYGEDDFGIWCAGAVWPHVTWRDIATIRASALSGDWRWRRELGTFDFVGSQLVNVPGFPLVRMVASAAGPVLVGGFGGPGSLEEEVMTQVIPNTMCPVHGPQTFTTVPRQLTACACQQVTPVQAAGAPAPPMTEAPPAPDGGGAEQRVAALEEQVAALSGQVKEILSMLGAQELAAVDAIPAALPALA